MQLAPAVRVLALALSLFGAGCAAPEPPPWPTTPPPGQVAPTPPPAPGHLARVEVDRVLVRSGPPWVLRRVQIEEVLRTDGKFAGWRVVGVPEDWRDIDLHPGDIVSRVNGLPLETPDEAWEAWKSVARATDLRVSLTRDGAARTLVLPIDGPPSPETAMALGREGPTGGGPSPDSRDPRDPREPERRGAVLDSADEAY